MDTIVNWLWQGSVVAIIAMALLRSSPRLSATARHRLWWIALVLVLALPLLPTLLAMQQGAPSPQPGSLAPTGGAAYVILLPTLSWWLVAGLWLTWLALTLGRTAAALLALNKAKRTTRPFPRDREARLIRWTVLRSQGRAARLRLSDDVRLAAVLGLTSPVVGVAPQLLERLSDADLDRIVVHEWAHVQRRDDLARLLQMLVTAVAGLHPAVWWIDRQIHLEREIACDDWAVNLTGSAKSYAACLTRLAEIGRHQRASALLPAALSSSHLRRRVLRLLDSRRSTATTAPAGPLALVGACMLMVAVLVAGVELVGIAAAIESRAPIPGAAPNETPQQRTAAVAPAATAQPAMRRDGSPRTGHDAGSAQARGESGQRADRPADPAAAVTPVVPPPGQTTGFPASIEASAGVPELPGTLLPVVLAPTAGDTRSSATETTPTPWGVAADAGVNVGRGSQKAAVATAGFFTRVSKSIARSFK
jgi:beta-lactamase regulating signal transducer with metallopeptidase domain